jgi:hypothetical protein
MREFMSKTQSDKEKFIHADMTVLDVVSKYRQTDDVFKKYDEQAGECICCQALFDPLKDVAQKYRLDLEKLIADLESQANSG